MIVERMMPARVAADRGVKQKYIFYVLMTFSDLTITAKHESQPLSRRILRVAIDVL